MKKIFVLLLLILLITTGCGGNEEDTTKLDPKYEDLVQTANLMVDSALIGYEYVQTEDSIKIESRESACFSLTWLRNNDYASDTFFEGYTGSVLVSYKKDKYVYNYWISDGKNVIENAVYKSDDIDVKNGSAASENCGGAKVFTCSAKDKDKGECK